MENLVHWSRDIVFGEDAQGAYIGHGPQAMAILRNLVLVCSDWPEFSRSNA